MSKLVKLSCIYGQPATIVELPNMVSWAYIIDVNGQKVVTTIFQLEDIDY